MLKLSKTQISLICLLGLMMLGQIGFVYYKESSAKEASLVIAEETAEEVKTSGTSAKAFGLLASNETHFTVSSVNELRHIFKDNDYNLKKAQKEGEVPRLFLAEFPQDMRKQKKSSNTAFIQVLLPYILKVNEQILADREKLIDMKAREAKGHKFTHSEKVWLSKLAADYRCKSTKIDSLLMHVDIVPPSLAIAQGMLETGGGRSFAAIQKNSLFGHMATKTKVQAFESLLHSVTAYANNLNRHKAYQSFRIQRAALRARNERVCGYKLAACLNKYSERGPAYTKDLQKLIDARGLQSYDVDHMRLKPQI